MAAGGWRDTTRIAGGHEELYGDILHANREALLQVLDEFSVELEQWRQALLESEAAVRLRLKAARHFRLEVASLRGWS